MCSFPQSKGSTKENMDIQKNPLNDLNIEESSRSLHKPSSLVMQTEENRHRNIAESPVVHVNMKPVQGIALGLDNRYKIREFKWPPPLIEFNSFVDRPEKENCNPMQSASSASAQTFKGMQRVHKKILSESIPINQPNVIINNNNTEEHNYNVLTTQKELLTEKFSNFCSEIANVDHSVLEDDKVMVLEAIISKFLSDVRALQMNLKIRKLSLLKDKADNFAGLLYSYFLEFCSQPKVMQGNEDQQNVIEINNDEQNDIDINQDPRNVITINDGEQNGIDINQGECNVMLINEEELNGDQLIQVEIDEDLLKVIELNDVTLNEEQLSDLQINEEAFNVVPYNGDQPNIVYTIEEQPSVLDSSNLSTAEIKQQVSEFLRFGEDLSNKCVKLCEVCGLSFKKEYLFQRHLATHGNELPFTCTICQASFIAYDLLRSHFKNYHSGKNIKYICELCDSGFEQEYIYKIHLEQHQLFSQNACVVCSIYFSSQKSLKIHMYRHKVTPVVKLMCEKCGKLFIGDERLQKHMLTHERVFQCSDCEKSFCRKVLLKQHMAIHLGEKHLSCYICGKKFKLRSVIKNHMERVHQKRPTYKCTHCEYKTYTKALLQNHTKVHTVKKLFACSSCDKKLPGKRALKIHMKEH